MRRYEWIIGRELRIDRCSIVVYTAPYNLWLGIRGVFLRGQRVREQR